MKIRKLKTSLLWPLLLLAGWLGGAGTARAVPSFARQTGLSCIACHTEFPILTDFGRNFKLNGFTLSTGQTALPPVAFFLQPSFTQTNQGQAGGAAPHFGPNSNLAITQASLFYSGRLFGPYPDLFAAGSSAAAFLDKFGIFSQWTIDGVARQAHWDNLELVYADSATFFGKPVTFGIFSTNNPGMEDPWNSTPVWTYPFSASGLAPTPAASGALVEGGLAQQVLGLGLYAMVSHSFYLDVAGYRTLDRGFQRAMGISLDGEAQIPGIAPYWRFAYSGSQANRSWELGTFGLDANTYPGRMRTAGRDHTLDLGLDGEYQISSGASDVTGLVSLVREFDRLSASQALGNSDNKMDTLWSFKANIDYLYDKTYGLDLGYFAVNGRRDPSLHSSSPNGSPASDGVVLGLVWLPINKNGGPKLWPKSNLKISLQYTIYNRFDGTHALASDHNTLYLESWIDF